ncbi:holin [Streptomyces sp. ISL-98]|uniref:holin n=1 Tax=Streptomyces sp. ISL-98 TaxID=2819192 RepID=UPI001BE7BB77|nr:holin [Streptomyces sp. ISL-98]MBT2508794.1 holin [Streptomyces sp. ISL-98]
MSNAPTEAKVKAASAMTFVVGLVLAVLNAVAADSSLLGPLPVWLQAVAIPLVPTALTWLAGYQARHTPRGPASV